MTQGEIIKHLLEERNIKQAELARYLGISANTVNRWIPKGDKKPINPSPFYLNQIAEFFDVPIDYLNGDYDYFDDSEIIRNLFESTEKESAWRNLLNVLGYTLTDATDYSQAEENMLNSSNIMPFKSQINIQHDKNRRTFSKNEFLLILRKFEKHLKIDFFN